MLTYGGVEVQVISVVQGIHKRMVRFEHSCQLKPHHCFVYALYMDVYGRCQAAYCTRIGHHAQPQSCPCCARWTEDLDTKITTPVGERTSVKWH